MDPHSFMARAEAQRWIGIAEKLLMGHDLVGSKTFAIRAKESDPRLEAADMILAIADTLLAAEKPVVGNNGSQQPDFYAILQLVRFVQDSDHIASQYRRLAVLLNPHQNRFPYADQAFQLVNDAWAVLSNPMRKSMYDSEIDFPAQQQMNPIGFNLEQQHQHHQHQQQQHNFFSINQMGSGHDQELADPPNAFQARAQQSHQQQQLQQHNFLSQSNPVRSMPVREHEQLFQVTSAPPHREQGQLFQSHVQPFQITSPTQQPRIQSPTPSTPAAAPPQPPFSWPQAPPLSQRPPPSQPQPQLQAQMMHSQLQQQHLQQEDLQFHQQLQQEQQHRQPPQGQESLEQNSSSVQFPKPVNINNGVSEEDPEEEEEEPEAETETAADDVDDSPTFWTMCPFCFYMHEYPRVYVDCTLRCDHCERAFQAVRVPSPPQIVDGQESYFYCWGFYPLGVSMAHLEKNPGRSRNSNWPPFSPLYDASSNVQNHLNGRAAPKENFYVKKSSGPRIHYDDITDDVFVDISESSDDSDGDLVGSRKENVKRSKRELKLAFNSRPQVLGVMARDARSGIVKNHHNHINHVPMVPRTDNIKKHVGSNPRMQSGRVAKDLGRLDLNVEFNNNEGEEAAPRMNVGNRGSGQGDEENIEGIGFFEGLDEFLSSLPILSVVNDDKVKAA